MDTCDVGTQPKQVDARLHLSVGEFRAVAEPWYRRDPVLHTTELTALRTLPAGSVMLTVTDGGQTIGAAQQTPLFPLACTAIPLAALDAVVTKLARLQPGLSGLRGLRDTATAFADKWCPATGRTATVIDEERLYRLGTLRDPAGMAGAPGDPAAHAPVVVDWLDLFHQEAFGEPSNPAASARLMAAAAELGDRFVVWVVGARPVSLAMVRAPVAGVARIGPVFTPRERRGHGYGSAVTAAAARLAQRMGAADVVLFTDLANPTSNAIYQRIGFEPVTDMVRIAFGDEGARTAAR
ncbi:GNAT family N-acetyltransferase [Micromonospora sp. WMMD736]|uniref:GNAT family N-acetyltransferase n=1 Tax=Micromonospora sp. WMMD736 TaxID=3404112 RepID=UPI003B953410